MIRRFAFVFLVCAALSLRAQTVPVAELNISSDRQEMLVATGESLLQGNVRLVDEGVLLLADEMRFNEKTQVGTATGHIQFTRGAVRLLADKLVYNRVDGTFTADNIRLGSYPYFIEGFSASGTQKEITVLRARASYGEPGPWQPTINADSITYAPGQQLRSQNVTIGIGHAQPVPIPRFDHKLGAPLIGTLALTGGYRRSLGVFTDGSLHVPITPGVRIGADLGVYTSRGVMAGPSGRYFNFENPDKLRGYFRSGYINDHGDKKTDILGRPIPEDRAYAEWQHQQQLTPNLTLNAQLNWWKDSEVLRDFRPRAFFPVQEPDTSVESVYTGGNYFVSAFARFQPNRFHRVQERLPEVRFDLLPLAVGNGFVERFSASAAVLREDPVPAVLGDPRGLLSFSRSWKDAPIPAGFGQSVSSGAANGTITPFFTGNAPAATTAIRSTRFDVYYAIERPFAPTDWFTFTPVAGGRMTSYIGSHEPRLPGQQVDPSINSVGATPSPITPPRYRDTRLGDYTRFLGEVGFDAALRTSGTFNYKNEQWKIDGLRHLFTPRLTYRAMPEDNRGRYRIARVDREVFSTYLRPLGLGDQRNIDDLHATNTLRLGFDNVLQTRDPVEGTRDLVVFNVANDFRFLSASKRAFAERDVSEVHTELALMPTRWLQVDVYQSFAPQNMSLREFNSGVTVRDGRFWSVRFGNNFLRHEIQDYSVDGRFRINERFEALTRHHYDARRRRFNEQSYGISQNLGNTWLVSYTVSLYSGRRRESGFGFNVQIDTVRF